MGLKPALASGRALVHGSRVRQMRVPTTESLTLRLRYVIVVVERWGAIARVERAGVQRNALNVAATVVNAAKRTCERC